MKEASDVIIVGGGPSGSFAALRLAERHISATVYEEHNEIGVPSHCPGHLSIQGLRRLGIYPLPGEIIENTFQGATFHSPNGKEFSVRLESPITCTVDRVLFDKYLAQRAQDAGVDYSLGSKVERLILEKGAVKGVIATVQGKAAMRLSNIVIDAEGISSRILRQTGLRGFEGQKCVNGIEAEVEGAEDTQPDLVEVFFGSTYAPGFYAWLIPKKNGKAKVGLGARGRSPRELLRKLMFEHPVASRKLKSARISHVALHPIRVGGPLLETYSNGFLAVGDAASQVKPTTGGGVIFGMTCAAIAAETACEAIRRDNFSSESLRRYQQRCDETLGFDMKMMLRIRRTLDRMSDETLDRLIGLCSKLNLNNALQGAEDLDFQGRTLLHVMKRPRALVTVGTFILTYLFANL